MFLLEKGQVHKLLEGPIVITNTVNELKAIDPEGAPMGFPITLVYPDGVLKGTFFDPNGEILETNEVIVIYGIHVSSTLPCKIVIFKNSDLDLALGTLLIS
jgi:hypothetical protein